MTPPQKSNPGALPFQSQELALPEASELALRVDYVRQRKERRSRQREQRPQHMRGARAERGDAGGRWTLFKGRVGLAEQFAF